MKSILVLSPLPPPNGGIASWTKSYLEWAQSRNHAIVHLNTSVIGKKVQNINSKTNILTEIRRSFLIYKKLRRVLKTQSFDIFHFNISLSGYGVIRDYILLKLAQKHNVSSLVQFHCSICDSFSRFNTIQRKYYSKIINNTNTLLCLNRKDFMFLKQKKNNVFIIPNFVKTDLFIQKKESNQEIKRIIFVGHVSRNKGINELLECASALPNITFDIIGPLSKEFDKNHSLKNVVFHGNQPFQEIVKFLNRADIFVLPSYSEGFSIAIIEAMAAGLPLIVSKVGANEDIVKTESGILMESISSSEIINGVYELSDISKRNNISKHNYTTAKEKYDIDVVLNQLFNLYGEIE